MSRLLNDDERSYLARIESLLAKRKRVGWHGHPRDHKDGGGFMAIQFGPQATGYFVVEEDHEPDEHPLIVCTGVLTPNGEINARIMTEAPTALELLAAKLHEAEELLAIYANATPPASSPEAAGEAQTPEAGQSATGA
jgi:hypothetical protein